LLSTKKSISSSIELDEKEEELSKIMFGIESLDLLERLAEKKM